MSLRDFAPHPVFGDLPVAEGVDTVAIDLPVGRLSAYRVVPDGPAVGTVLVVPGYTGSKEDFRVTMPLLRDAGFEVIVVSRRGQADSVAPPSLDDHTLDEEARDIVRIAPLLADGRPVHLLGHSLGGVIGRAAVLQAPELFSSYTMLCSGPHGWTDRKYLERHLVAEKGGAALFDSTNPITVGLDDAELAALDPELAFVRMRMRRTSPHSLIGGARILELRDDTTEALAATGVPVLVAHGEWDAAWPIPWQRDMASRLGARYEIVAGAWHSPQIEQPEATVALLADFWGSVPAPTRAS